MTEIATIPKEYQEQKAFVDWLTIKGYLFFAISNGGYKLSPTAAIRLCKTGLKRGVPDLMIPEPFNGRPGLFIEMKRKKGGHASVEQKWWRDTLNAKGYVAKVCKGFDDAVKVVEDYFK